ncbi:hypothetical protein NE237_032897 [Protea cynaroides]|uniref:Protodermal factor 1 n=1 Tax=Protea cynaroides TaxID=273540 RepID=A0A9Q0R3I8_9MAGN|nr:hypothetical protein NE237_032897 [Protea cynaroides]
MDQRRSPNSLFIWALIAVFVSQNLVIPVMSRTFEDQKNYYFPPTPCIEDPYKSPPHGTSPSHGSTPSHGSGGSYNPTPSTPSHGSGGSYNPTPSTPSHGSGGSHNPTPSTPSAPSTGSGGYYHSPPSSGTGGGTPSSPTVGPSTPTIPVISPPSTPLLPDPNTPLTGTCTFWRTHPGLIWSLLGWWGTLGGVFGSAGIGTTALGANLSLPQALANTRRDGIGALYREGTASYLNSMVNKKFPFTTTQVKDSFVRAVASNKAAAAQAELFKQANEGRLKPRT